MIEQFQQLNITEIGDFRKTGKSNIIPAEVQAYILQIDRAVEVYRFEGNITRAAKKLQSEFAKEGICFNTARNRIYDAINIFHINSTVRNEAWDQYYADKMEDLAKLAIVLDDYGEARRCYMKAHEMRTKRDEAAYDPDKMKPIDEIVSPDVSFERLGLKDVNLKKLWVNTNKFIDKLDIKTAEKNKIKEEVAAVTGEPIDIDHEEIK